MIRYYFIIYFLIIVFINAQSIDEYKQNKLIESAFKNVNNHYVKEVNSKAFTENGINRVLDQLDPFSELIPPNKNHSIDELQTGGFGGLGIRISKQGKILKIVSVMDGTPADRVGLIPGDEILQIDSVEIKDIKTRDISRRLRGKPGSVAKLLVKRWGIEETLIINITREHIKIPIISYAGILEPGIGYVKFTKFSKQSSRLLETKLHEFEKNDVKWLILDLRSNPGGLLQSAVEICDLFLPRKFIVIETKGRIDRLNRKFYTRRNEIFPNMNLIVLINRSSASASEILSGVLQDYERAIILGTKSFGKGLVQSIMRLPNGYRMKMTTAHYYLPSGRLIQRQNYAESVVDNGINPPDTTWFKTIGGRSFQQGDGITPDIYVAPLLLSKNERNLWKESKFYNYSLELTRKNSDLNLPYEPSDEIIQDFRLWANDSSVIDNNPFKGLLELDYVLASTNSSLNDSIKTAVHYLTQLESSLFEDYQYELNADRIKRGLSMETGMILAGTSARIQASLKYDLVLEKALDLIHHPDEVKELLTAQ